MRLIFFGSGDFGLPTLDHLHAHHDIALVVSQPARPAGRKRVLTPTPIEAYAADHDLPAFTPDAPNDADAIARIHDIDAEAFVVIAYGHKLSEALLGDRFAINLHASLLPKYRGAAPINRAMIANESHTGVSVITLAQRMDAGAVLATSRLRIDPMETAGELHDRLAALGPDVVASVLDDFRRDALAPVTQDETLACPAPKFTKADGTTDFNDHADRIRARIHGLTPWPGCTVRLAEQDLKVTRVRVDQVDGTIAEPGTILDDGTVACATGSIALLAVTPAGGKSMTFEAYRRGRNIEAGTLVSPKTITKT
ncbi:MAG: methionyl-tRNA formyltransferase [Planctomycetota bacterium]